MKNNENAEEQYTGHYLQDLGARERQSANAKFFSIAVLISVACYWLIMMLTRSANIDAYFVTDHHDTAMDYFNMLANLNESDPWYANANYPALPFVFWKVMHRIVPMQVWGNGFQMREDMIAQLGYFLLVMACFLMVWEAIRSQAKGSRAEKLLFCCAIAFSGPMFFLLERGNILMAVLAFSMLFLVLYDSEKRSYRILAYLCLSVAAGIKMYPAVLGLLVLWKKRYKEAALLVVMGAFTFLAPFFVFNGFGSLMQMLHGITVATDIQTGIGLGINFCMNNFVQMVAAWFGHNLTQVPGWVPIASVAVCLGLYAVSKSEWKKLYALVLLCVWFPTFSYTYTLVLFFLPLVSFFFRSTREEQGIFHWVYTGAFVLLVIPYALPMVDRINDALCLGYVKFPVSWGMLIMNLVLVLIAVLIAVEWVIGLVNSKRNK